MKRLPIVVVVALALGWTAWFGWFTIARHDHLNSSRFDLGNVEQTLWNTVHGHFFTMTNPYGTEQVSRLAFHGDLFLLTLVPFYAMFPRPETLILLQVLAVASGGLAVWFLAKRFFGNQWWGVLFSAVYFVLPSTQWATIFDIHAVTFATPIILWTLLAMFQKKYWWMMAGIVLAMLAKEEVGISLAAIGLYVLIVQHRRSWGLAAMVIPLAWAATMVLWIMPAARSSLATPPPVYDSVLGSSALTMATTAVLHPLKLAAGLGGSVGRQYFWQVGGQFGFLFLLNPWSLAALPDAAINVLSTKPAQHLVMSQYTGNITPWLLLGSMAGAGWMLKKLSAWKLLSMWPYLPAVKTAGWVILWAGWSAWALGPLPGTPHDWTRFATWKNEYIPVIQSWREILRPADAVAVTNNLGSQFARRERLYSFPLGIDLSDYLVVLEHHGTPVVATDAHVDAEVNVLRNDPQWMVVESFKDLTIFQRWKK